MKISLLAIVLALGALPHTSRADDSSGRTLAGSIQLDYLGILTDKHARERTLDGATIELSLKLTKDFSKDVSASVKVCYACHGFEAGMAYVEMRASDELRLRAGRMTPSFGSFPLRHDPANHLTSDKPLPYDMGRMIRRTDWNEGILPAPWVDNGVEVAGTHFWDGGQLDYAAYVFGGPRGAPDGTDFDFTESRSPSQYYVDNNSQPVIGGRASVSLDLSDTTILVLGASGMTGTYDPDRKLGFVIAGADAVLQIGTAYLRAEWLFRRTQMALGDDPATKFKFGPGADGTYDNFFVKDGFYAEAEVPVGPLSLIGRWDGLRRNGNVLASSDLASYSYMLRYTAALAVRLKSGIRLKTSAEYYQFSDFGNDVALHLGIATPF